MRAWIATGKTSWPASTRTSGHKKTTIRLVSGSKRQLWSLSRRLARMRWKSGP